MVNGIKYEDVKNAILNLENRGENVTHAAIRRELGDTGSYTTIKNNYDKYREDMRRGNSIPNKLPDDLEKEISDSLRRVWEIANSIASADVEKIRSSTNCEVGRLDEELTESFLKIDEQNNEINRMNNIIEAYKKELSDLKIRISQIETERNVVNKQYNDLLSKVDSIIKDPEK